MLAFGGQPKLLGYAPPGVKSPPDRTTPKTHFSLDAFPVKTAGRTNAASQNHTIRRRWTALPTTHATASDRLFMAWSAPDSYCRIRRCDSRPDRHRSPSRPNCPETPANGSGGHRKAHGLAVSAQRPHRLVLGRDRHHVFLVHRFLT